MGRGARGTGCRVLISKWKPWNKGSVLILMVGIPEGMSEGIVAGLRLVLRGRRMSRVRVKCRLGWSRCWRL